MGRSGYVVECYFAVQKNLKHKALLYTPGSIAPSILHVQQIRRRGFDFERGSGARTAEECPPLAARVHGPRHDEELRRTLPPLAADFRGWGGPDYQPCTLISSTISTEQSTCEACARHAQRDMTNLHLASAIARQILVREPVPADVLKHIRREVELCKRLQEGEEEAEGPPTQTRDA
jgi:hypothetical protein